MRIEKINVSESHKKHGKEILPLLMCIISFDCVSASDPYPFCYFYTFYCLVGSKRGKMNFDYLPRKFIFFIHSARGLFLPLACNVLR